MAADGVQKRGHLGNVVVIGGNGFLGSHIVNQALSLWTADSVTSIDLRCSHNRNPAAHYHECDITDGPRLAALLDRLRPDVVIHTASPVAAGALPVSDEVFYKVNVDGTRCVVQACQKAAVKGLVYTSSASVVNDNKTSIFNADESWPVIRGAQQSEYYTETKAAAEELVLQANRQDPYKLLTASLRPSGIFGESDAQVLRGILRAFAQGKTTFQAGDNNNIFDFSYVGNIAHAHLLAAHALLATAARAPAIPLDHERVDGEAFFITNDSPCYFWDFARAIWRAAGGCNRGVDDVTVLPRGLGLFLGHCSEVFFSIIRKPAVFTRHAIVMATITRYYNINKAKRVLHYEPLWTLQEGVTRGVRSFFDADGKLQV
ncbi:Sterol-4-alpha-carboxylate 3-dehydrogenase [Escovopsis weberi]|uniref:Sterol-4-alpha-carboxylate 3-dehydrogenase n=1 Tax=Escovopsis weberi TaxID=150374 RepID=A0A0M9VUQ9_ESCWE|nr:Sterol-4-alpha-carboxylate 3-dehydrogenase [Escovopsis weberi]